MQPLGKLAPPSPMADVLLKFFGDFTEILLLLAIAYLVSGIARSIIGLLPKDTHWVWQQVRKFCQVILVFLLYVIAALHALEYLMLKAADTT